MDQSRSLSLYLQPRVLRLAAFGFASGLPYLLVFSTLGVWLREEGVSLTHIGFFALAGWAYVAKFAWAPVVDHLKAPVFGKRFGQRRSWLLLSQLGVIASLLLISTLTPAEHLTGLASAAVALAIFSATQDICADAYRIDSLEAETQSAGAGVFVGGYRVGLLVSGAGALLAADAFDWPTAYRIMAVAMAVGLAATLLSPEPPRVEEAGPRGGWAPRALAGPFQDFASRKFWFAILLFIAAFQVGEGLLGLMANPFYIDLGFTKTEIAVVTKGWGFAMAIAGGLAGGWLGFRFGLLPALFAAGVFQGAANLTFAWLAGQGGGLTALTLVVAVENFSGAMASALFVGFIGSLCNPRFSATQFALLTAVAALGRKVFAAGGGVLADALGWQSYFTLSAAAAIPALLVLLLLIRLRVSD